MTVFVAGATGVIGIRLVPLLVAAGHDVAAMTRTFAKTAMLRDLGATPVVCDVYDSSRLIDVVGEVGPEVMISELTDLPDDPRQIAELGSANNRIRREGTDNLLVAARGANVSRIVMESVAWPLEGDGADAVAYLERETLAVGGVVLRYGQLYGPGTYHEDTLPPHPRVHVDEAARRTVTCLESETGVFEIVEGR